MATTMRIMSTIPIANRHHIAISESIKLQDDGTMVSALGFHSVDPDLILGLTTLIDSDSCVPSKSYLGTEKLLDL